MNHQLEPDQFHSQNSNSSTSSVQSVEYVISAKSVAANAKVAALAKSIKDKELQAKKEEKAAEKLRKKKERDDKKAAKAVDKALKDVDREVVKSMKPGEAQKNLTLLICNELEQRFQDLIEIPILSAEMKLEYVNDPLIKKSISFQREIFFKAIGPDMKVNKTSTFHNEDDLITLIDMEDAVKMINAQVDKDSYGMNLQVYIESMKTAAPGKKISFFIMGLSDYFKKQKQMENKEFRNKVLEGENGSPTKKRKKKETPFSLLPKISEYDLQSALCEVQINCLANIRQVKNEKEFIPLLLQLARAVSDAPFKKEKMKSGFDWHALADSYGGIKVTKEGVGMKDLWVAQLLQMPSTTIDIAKAIANNYHSPRALFEAYKYCGESEGEKLLQDINVRMGVGPLARNRRLGPELSKKYFLHFTSTNPERYLSQ